MTASELLTLIVLVFLGLLLVLLSPQVRTSSDSGAEGGNMEVPRRSRLIVRAASVATAVLALSIGISLGVGTWTELPARRSRWPWLGCVLVAVVPIMFLWASAQGWRLRRSGVVSICSGWLLFGWFGVSVCLLYVVRGDHSLLDFLGLALYACVFLVGVIVARQAKYFGP